MTAITARGGRLATPLHRRFPLFRTLCWLIALATCLAVLYPIWHIILESLGLEGSAVNLRRILHIAFDHQTIHIVLTSIGVVAASGGAAFILGVTLAFINERTDARLGWAADILPVLPMLVPPVAGAIGWVFLAAPVAGYLNVWIRSIAADFGVHWTQGPLNIFTWWGMVFVYTLYLIPFVYLPVAAALRSLDSSIEEAARVSGAGPWQTMRRVTIPSLRPAIGAALLYVVAHGFAMFTVAIVIGTQANISVVPVEIVKSMTGYPPDLTRALALSFWVILIVGIAWWLQTRLSVSERHATIGARASSGPRAQMGNWKWPVRFAMVLYLIITSILPFVALLLVAVEPYWSPTIAWHTLGFQNFRHVIHDPLFGAAFKNSIMLGAITATITVLIAAFVTYIVHSRRSRTGGVVNEVMKVPTVVPHVVFGVALVLAFTGAPFHWSGTFLILGLAYFIIYLPQASVQATTSFVQVGRPLREAASVAGAGPGRIFRSILLPLMTPGLAAGWALLFVLMAGDVTVSVMLAGPNTPVIGFVIVGEWETGTFAGIAALSVLIALVSSLVVLTVLRFARTGRFTVSGRT